jgi:hypothetical protein
LCVTLFEFSAAAAALSHKYKTRGEARNLQRTDYFGCLAISVVISASLIIIARRARMLRALKKRDGSGARRARCCGDDPDGVTMQLSLFASAETRDAHQLHKRTHAAALVHKKRADGGGAQAT